MGSRQSPARAGFLFEKMGDDRDRIRMGERMMDDRAIARITAEQRALSVPCKVVNGFPRLLCGWQHGAGEHGGGGMGQRVMHMQHRAGNPRLTSAIFTDGQRVIGIFETA